VARLSRARWTVGFSAPEVWRGGFFDEVVPFNRYWHVARNARSLAGGENGEAVKFSELIRPASTEAGRSEARRRLADGPIRPSRPLVVVNVNAGQLALERRWPKEHFVALLNGLLGLTEASARHGLEPEGLRIVLAGAPDEREYVEGIRQALLAPELVENAAGDLTLDGLVALLEGAALLVSNDSGPLQVGAALGRPVVALFGPETPVMYAPLSPGATVLYRPPACSPCINVHDNKLATCHVGHALCMEKIEPEEVLAEAARILSGSSAAAGAR
jgi:ADP-heptose:LPS heptosyltransferase